MELLDKKYVELINKEIDHIITPAEKKKLDDYLSDNLEAQRPPAIASPPLTAPNEGLYSD